MPSARGLALRTVVAAAGQTVVLLEPLVWLGKVTMGEGEPVLAALAAVGLADKVLTLRAEMWGQLAVLVLALVSQVQRSHALVVVAVVDIALPVGLVVRVAEVTVAEAMLPERQERQIPEVVEVPPVVLRVAAQTLTALLVALGLLYSEHLCR